MDIRAFSSSPLAGRFLAPWNLTRPLLPPRVLNQVKFMALDCDSMTLHKFMSYPGPCRGHTIKFFFFLFFFVSSSEGFAAWYEPLLRANLADWWRSPDYLVFLVLVISLTLILENFLSSFEVLTKLYKLRESLGCGFKPLNDEFFLTIFRE